MNSKIIHIYCKEHESIPYDSQNPLHQQLRNELEGIRNSEKVSQLKYMGLEYDFKSKAFNASYYVGADWLDKRNQRAIIVKPKIDNIDCSTMFMRCFECDEVNDDLDDLFYIRSEDSSIALPFSDFQIEPLLIVYFINLLASISKTGLRKDYVAREETLHCKIKGKILLNKYITHGIATNRKDNLDCRYSEYDVDCLDNRVLKAALLFCSEIIQRNKTALGSLHCTELNNLLKIILPAFEKVSPNITMQDLQRVRINPLFKYYKAAIPIAKLIIKRQGYCVNRSTDGKAQLFPPFIIDMPKLFERYVYVLLKARYGNLIGFQIHDTYRANFMDFAKYDEHMVIDTKYKPIWDTNQIDHDNVRQLSGYARNIELREQLRLKDKTCVICPCLIIYPSKNGISNLRELKDILWDDEKLIDIPRYLKFKKLPIKLPIA